MAEKDKISIIVPTYNRKVLFERTLRSLLEQSYRNIEIVVVNDCGESVRGIIDSYNDDRIKYYSHQMNKGLAESRNTGMRKCTGDYICFLDDDDIFLPYTLETRMYWMKKLGAEIVYTRALRDIWERHDVGYVSVGKQLYWDCEFNQDKILIQNIAPCCCPLFSRKAWDLSGNYKLDRSLSTGEDYDFWIALSRKTEFHELKLVDCECSYRNDKTQMTGVRNFAISYPIIYKRWIETALDKQNVRDHQNHVLKSMGLPELPL